VIRRVDLRGVRHSKAEVQDLLPRATLDVNEAMKLIAPILSRVKNGGVEDLYA
jgi:histidinol dehydrogenase